MRALPCLLGWFLVVSISCACDTPVFRYALEYWPPDLYQIKVLHDEPLTPEQQALITDLHTAGEAYQTNVAVETIDIRQQVGHRLVSEWEAVGEPALPWLIVQYPSHLRIREPIWTGPFTAASIDFVLHSPVRTKIAQQILGGDSAVWLLIESGIPDRDEAAFTLLEAQLQQLERRLRLPVPLEEFSVVTEAPSIELRIDFSIQRVARDDPQEQPLIQMLLQGIPEEEGGPQPVVCPIFGRGRALCALSGDTLDEWNIEDASAFLVGRCSCQVKELNPGMDLLISTTWHEELGMQVVSFEEPAPRLGLTNSDVSNGAGAGVVRRNTILVVVAQLVAVALGAGFILWRRSTRKA